MTTFAGDKKTGRSLLAGPEERLKRFLLPRVPRRVETYHLTMLTLLWCVLIIAFSFLARHHIAWLWAVSLTIVLQYVTDLLDGAVGRQRDTGLVKWGYYMDHFLDYLFLCSILIGYAILLPDHFKYMLFFVLALFGAFMTHSFLAFAATNEFRISYLGIGPTEIRLIFIAVNTLLIVFGRTHMVAALPYVLGGSAFGLFVTVFRTQRHLWQLDLHAKQGPAPAADRTPAGIAAAAVLTPDSPDPVARVVAHVGLSYLLAAVAFAFLMTRTGYPHHRALAAGVYLLSLIPFALSVRARRATLRRQRDALRRRLRPYWPHVGVAVGIAVFAYVVRVVAPAEDSLLVQLSDGELREDIERDATTLGLLNARMGQHLDAAVGGRLLSVDFRQQSADQREAVREWWGEYLGLLLDLDILQRRYRGFYLIDYNTSPDLHAECFLLAYGAFAAKYDACLRLLALMDTNPFLQPFLDEAVEGGAIAGGSLTGIRQRVAHPDNVLRLHAGAAYLPLVSERLRTNRAHALHDLHTHLARVVSVVGKHPSVVLNAPLDFLEHRAFDAWLPLQKEVAVRMSEIRTTDRAYFITPECIRNYRQRLQPGDILLERRNWHMTNLGIPGFWPHAALYIGTPDELDAFFAGVASPDDGAVSEQLRRHAPDAMQALAAPDTDGYAHCVIEAIRDGVVFTSLEHSANCDYLAVLRPRVDRAARLEAVRRALAQYGKPYDYNFDFSTDSALVCSELVYKAYETADGVGLRPIVQNGRLLLPPNRIARWFDETCEAQPPRVDLVLFLDGHEGTRSVREGTLETFRASWRRPKWDLLAE